MDGDYLIFGPRASGKTSLLIRIVYQALKTNQYEEIVLLKSPEVAQFFTCSSKKCCKTIVICDTFEEFAVCFRNGRMDVTRLVVIDDGFNNRGFTQDLRGMFRYGRQHNLNFIAASQYTLECPFTRSLRNQYWLDPNSCRKQNLYLLLTIDEIRKEFEKHPYQAMQVINSKQIIPLNIPIVQVGYQTRIKQVCSQSEITHVKDLDNLICEYLDQEPVYCESCISKLPHANDLLKSWTFS